MTPDLTTNQFIAIVTTIVGACLIAFFTAIIVLTWREDILQYLYRHGLLLRPRRRQSPPPFPLHFIFPRGASNTMMDRPILEEQRLESRAPYPPDSSDEFPQRTETPPPRNATPGPSGTRHTPTPPSSPAPEEANDRDLRARYDRFPPPEYDPNDLPPPERALLPVRPRALMANPVAPAQRIFIRPPPGQFPPDESSDEDDGGFFRAVARRRNGMGERLITITTDDEDDLDALELPAPDDDGDESLLHLPPPRRPDDPLNADGLDYEWPELEDIDRDILGPERSLAWEIRRNDVEVRYNLATRGRPSMGFWLAISNGDDLPRLGREAGLDYRAYTEAEPTRNNWPSKKPSRPSPDNWETAQTWKAADQNDFDNFYYDDYNPYAEELPAAPFPLPDSPDHERHLHQPPHPRRLHGYHPPQYGQHPFAGGDNPNRQEEGSEQPIPDPAKEEKRQAANLAEQKLQEIADLEK
ncbi:uncharacterized protein ARMOST_22205 [Armillaria ostoyae]|uniref:Uncharacterized protein n=1 Tax=Armillaria ostoyae TaxID=47428 RepID=A0A284SC74_ARMOS|nr:uncharacterized protein ARMOST_22205 [Armillaria ostoyae]